MHRSILTGLLLLGAVAVHGTKRPSRREVEVAERSELSSDKMGRGYRIRFSLGKSLGKCRLKFRSPRAPSSIGRAEDF